MATHYYLGPWKWGALDADDDGEQWHPPREYSALDLRPLPLQARRGGTPGYGLFVGEGLIADASYDLLGSGDWSEIATTERLLTTLQAATGRRLEGTNLKELLVDLFTAQADPSGDAGPRPLMPGRRGLRLVVGKKVYARSFDSRDPHFPVVADMNRRAIADYWSDVVADRRTADQARKILGGMLRKYGLDNTEWEQFVPPDLRDDIIGPLEPTTTLTESFNKSDSGTLGPDQTWTEVSGTWSVVSNQCVGYSGSARAEADVSSSDMHALADLHAVSSYQQSGPAARFSSSAETYYTARFRNNTHAVYVYKVVSGSATLLDSQGSIVDSFPDELKLTVDGSDLDADWNGVNKVSTTDSSITTGTRGGISATSGSHTCDDWEAEDLGGAPSVSPWFFQNQIVHRKRRNA